VGWQNPSTIRLLAFAAEGKQTGPSGVSRQPLPRQLRSFIDKPVAEASMRGIAITPVAGTADTILLRVLTGEIKSASGLSTTPGAVLGLNKEQMEQLRHPNDWPSVSRRIEHRKELKGGTPLEQIDNIGSQERSLLEVVLSEAQKNKAMRMQLSI